MRRLPACAALFAASLLAGCGEEKKAEAPPPRPVLTVAVAPRTERVVATFAGTIAPRYLATVGFRVPGRIATRTANLGDIVHKGETLAVLDDTAQAIQLRIAEADIANAEAVLRNAVATADRQRVLLGQGNTPVATYEIADRNRQAAQARLDQALAARQSARDQLSFTRLTADFDGVVSAVTGEVGQVVSPGQGVFTIARADTREAVVDVPNALIERFAPGTAVVVAFDRDRGVTAPGRVREVAPEADAMTRTRRVRIEIDAPPVAFRLGTTVVVSLVETIAPVIDVPATALREKDGTTAVWIADPKAGTVSLKPVTVVERAGPRVTLADALAPGTLVVTAGVNRLTEGQKVRVGEGALP